MNNQKNFLNFYFKRKFLQRAHCVKSVRIRSYSGLYFPAFGMNTDQYTSEHEHFLPCGYLKEIP